jgi:hypothetical protein
MIRAGRTSFRHYLPWLIGILIALGLPAFMVYRVSHWR